VWRSEQFQYTNWQVSIGGVFGRSAVAFPPGYCHFRQATLFNLAIGKIEKSSEVNWSASYAATVPRSVHREVANGEVASINAQDCCLAGSGDHHGYGRSGTAHKLWEVPLNSQVSIALPIYAKPLSPFSHQLGTYPTCIHSPPQDIVQKKQPQGLQQ
jgi:hypothetical protein